MVCFKGFWRWKGMGFAAAILAILTLACSGKSSTYKVSGTVTYTRRALVKDSNGIPTGLSATYGGAQAARGVRVRAIEARTENSQTAYSVVATTTTDSNGNYSLSIPKDYPAFIEVQSIAATTSNTIRLVSEANKTANLTNISSGTASADYTLYSLRKGLDGSSGITPATAAGSATVNFAVGSSTQWLKAASPVTAIPNATLESSPSGSRILAILDSIYVFSYYYGDPTPGGTLDLFYRPTMSNPSRGSFVNFVDSSHYYGALRADSTNDDAWDEGIIYALCARNALYSHTSVTPYFPADTQLPLTSVDFATRTSLDPAFALIEGMSYGMAATLLNSPYIADTTGDSAGTLAITNPLDIRNTGAAQLDEYSAPAIAALSWNIYLKANGLSSANSSSTWSGMTSSYITRFFTLVVPVDSSSRPTDTASIYKQLLRLEESKSSSDAIDLASKFSSSDLSTLAGAYGITWPRSPVPGTYLEDWDTDPNGTFTLNLDMNSAQQWDLGSTTAYPNLSKGELYHAKFLMTKDALYSLGSTVSGLPSGGTVEVKIWTASGSYNTYTISANTSKTLDTSLMLAGDGATPKYVPVHVRLLSQTLPTSSVTVQLTFTQLAD